MQTKIRTGSITAGLIAVALSGTINAETVSDALLQCANQSNSLQRLVCFDKVVQNLRDYDSVDAVLIPRAQISSNQSGAIEQANKTLPSADTSDEPDSVQSFGKPKRSENATYLVDGDLHSTIAEIIEQQGRRLRFVLANDQVWEKTSGGTAGLPRIGDEIIIRRGALGSFFIRKKDANRSFQVKRITG